METDPVFETLCFLVSLLEYRKMGKIQKPGDSEIIILILFSDSLLDLFTNYKPNVCKVKNSELDTHALYTINFSNFLSGRVLQRYMGV
jgi:hypothetical protein